MKHKRSALILLLVALLFAGGIVGIGIFLSVPDPIPEEADTEESQPAEVPTPIPILPVPPKPPPKPAVVVGELSAPDGFPERHAGFSLVSLAEQEITAGVNSYFVARYQGEDAEELSIRFLALEEETAPRFLEHMLEALLLSGAVKKLADLEQVPDSGWETAELYSRDDAGMMILANPRALVVVSAPSPDIAKLFGSSLKFVSQKTGKD